ncbi:PQQ-dependent sugar dehydrogenase [Halieaceae bacterium IMCC14734]|uniref:PQQ-dependent sugar dehydrogenase n=1 Tax=Candidatus Litorirhabdus singularis TaxID=2518993 RepID=A0ABT3TGE6_9GAMM|nr:PQQ-dependent sugar dehydrogenase [Candidatus Litorirhabdus singularis]MCX2980477.1 PQQ-dependent sugar dehydrogenase [Candidatus Litorirhabdus singularis]
MMMKILGLTCFLLLIGCDAMQGHSSVPSMASDTKTPYQARDVTVSLRTVAQDLEFPWDMVFISDVEFLVTEKVGRLTRINLTSGSSTVIGNIPEVAFEGQGGLLGVTLHPRFPDNGLLYLSYSIALPDDTYSTRLLRARLADNQLHDSQVVFTAAPALKTTRHFGGAMVFDDNGHLYLSVGDRGRRENAQDLSTDLGKIHRLTDTGGIPSDNPLIGQNKARQTIFSWGHRNPQGLAIHPQSRELWAAEHGPQGGDEINLIRGGANYGWPVITYGEEYGGGAIGEGGVKAGMEQPVHYYVPSIATAGIGFYTGNQIPQWQNNLFVTGLRAHVSRLALAGQQMVAEELLFENLKMRTRGVETGPDGALYLLSEIGSIVVVEAAPGEPVTAE